ncbi:hypothetical protein AX14_013100 [Amanita brunnescens Koide BX004]|nr:hypothetical protein AX14_013100 [Amanita brunnescens Koide BX004]
MVVSRWTASWVVDLYGVGLLGHGSFLTQLVECPIRDSADVSRAVYLRMAVLWASNFCYSSHSFRLQALHIFTKLVNVSAFSLLIMLLIC